MTRGSLARLTTSVLAVLCLFALGACSSGKPHAASATTTSTPSTAPKQALPPLDLEKLPVPSHFTCPAGNYFVAPANQAAGICVPYAYLLGGTASDPNNHTACPAGSLMTMGPVECDNETGIVTPVPPGPDTCSTPGGPCASSKLPLSPQASVISFAALALPAGRCPADYYFGQASGIATCVPYDYLPGGTPANPNHDTACPAGSGLKLATVTGTLCIQDAAPHDIVAPVPAASA